MGRKKCDEKVQNGKKQKMLLFGALVGCIIMAVKVYSVMKPYNSIPQFILEQNASKISISRSNYVDLKKAVVSKLSNYKTDVYEINGDVRIHGVSSTIFIASSDVEPNSTCWIMRPHPRKGNPGSMNPVKNFKVITTAFHKTPPCNRNYINIPAILFSVGGIAPRNYFHSFADVLIPLFLTSRPFNRTTVFLMSNYNSSWTSKYRFIIEKLSKYDVHDIDTENEVLCFSRMIVGLEAYNDLEMKTSTLPLQFLRTDFVQLLQLKHVQYTNSMHDDDHPRMLIISREKTRKLMNQDEIGEAARRVGFEVVMREMPTNVSLMAQFVNSFEVMVGVHGAGLTNMVFLPENAVVIQIVPYGVEYLAWICFESGMQSNKLKSINYTLTLNESSLLRKYPPNSTIYTDPGLILSKNFPYFSTVYLQNQDMNLDLNRFRGTLLKALELLRSN